MTEMKMNVQVQRQVTYETPEAYKFVLTNSTVFMKNVTYKYNFSAYCCFGVDRDFITQDKVLK